MLTKLIFWVTAGVMVVITIQQRATGILVTVAFKRVPTLHGPIHINAV
jgi:hypothetical protein